MTCLYTIDGKDYTLPQLKTYLAEGGIDALYPEGDYPWSENERQSANSKNTDLQKNQIPASWENPTNEDDGRWFGTVIEKKPEFKKEQPTQGKVHRVYKGSSTGVIEFQPGGTDSVFRLRPDQISKVIKLVDNKSTEEVQEKSAGEVEDAGNRPSPGYYNANAKNDEIFRHPTSDSKTLKGIMAEVMPGAEFMHDNFQGGTKVEAYQTEIGKIFWVYEKDDQVWIDVSNLKTGDFGNAIYAAVGNYAYNTGKVFTGDPNGLSEAAVIRRTNAMLSLALKFGSTDFLGSSPEQAKGNPAKGIQPLKWGKDFAENVKSLIDTMLAPIYDKLPILKGYRYDFDSQQFENKLGRPLSPNWASRLAQSDSGRMARAGEATLRRAVILQSIASSTGREKSELLERIKSGWMDYSRYGLGGIFSKTNTGTSGSTVAEITALLPRKVKALLDAGKLNIVQFTDKGEGVEGYVENGTIVLVADNLNKNNLNSVLSHELLHFGLSNDPKLKAAYDRFKNDMQRRFDLAAKGLGSKADIEAYKRVIAAETQAKDQLEEMAAYLITAYQTNPQSLSERLRKAIQDFIGAIRGFLVRSGLDFGYIKTLTPADLAAMANIYGANVSNATNFSKISSSAMASTNPSNPDIRYSKSSTQNSLLSEAKRKAGLGQKKTLSQAIADILSRGVSANWQAAKEKWADIKPLLEQGLFDKFLGIRLAEKEILGEVAHSVSGYISARFSTGSSSSMQALLLHGHLEWSGGVLQVKDGSKSFAEILQPVKDDLENFTAWMVGRRADRLFKDGKENNFSRDEIDALLELEQESYQGVADDIADMNGDVLDLAQEAGLIDAESRKLWESADYIPFYRLQEGMKSAGPRAKNGLSHQTSGIKMLKGGENPLSDPLGNMMQNWAHLIDASMKNSALDKTLKNLDGSRFVESVPRVRFTSALIPKEQIKKLMLESGLPEGIIDAMPPDLTQGIAKMWAMQAPTDPDIVRVMRNGKTEYFRVNDGMLLTSLTALNQMPFGGIFKPMRYMKRLLTGAVTADPTFMARNFIRDSMHSWTIAEEKGFKLGIDSIHGAIKSFKEEGGYVDMMAAGASFQGGYGNYNNPDSARETMDSALRKKGIKDIRGFKDSILDTPKKYWEMYRTVGDAIENASREAILENSKRAGDEKAKYLFEAKDIMDFSMQGSFTIIRALSDMLPFFNARLVGLYRLAKAGKTAEAKKMILAKGVSIAMLSLALLALNSGDDDYEALEDWDKDQYWHFFFGDQHYRLPKPFELGLIFGTIPERSARALFGPDTLGDFGGRMAHGASDTLAFNPIPQLFKPFIELYANKDMFTGRPIEGMADEGKLPSARYNERTSETMRKLSELLPEWLGASPKRIEHLMHGYLGAMGMYALGATDLLVREISGMPELPERRIDSLPVIRAFYQEAPALHTKYGTQFYEQLREVDQIYRTINAYRKEGEADKANELVEEGADKLKSRKSLTAANKQISALRKQVDIIYRSNLSASTKRERIDSLMKRSNDIAKKVVERTHPYFD